MGDRLRAAVLSLLLLAAALADEPAPAEVAAAPPPTAPADEPPADPTASAAPPADAAPTAPPDAPPGAPREVRWSVLPNVSYDSDDRFGLGARAQIDVLRDGYEPYRASYVLHLFATTNGYHHHRFRFDLVGLGKNGSLRLTGHLAFRAWLNDGYWGIGNGTVRDAQWEGTFDKDDPAAKHYRYSLVQPFSNLTLRAQLGGPWRAYGSAQLRWTFVRAYDGSLLDEERPFGMDGGPAFQVSAGFLHDTREPEVSPDRGFLFEAGGRVVLQAQGAPFGGPFLSARAYATVVPHVVYAARWMGEYLAGDVPFYEMVHWGGFVPIPGFGGADTLRGVPFGRWRAPGKMVLDNEVRIDFLKHRAFHEELRWQLVPLADVGMVFGAGTEASDTGMPLPVHPTAGMGVRAIWATTLVGRADVALGQDWVRAADGTLGAVPDVGIYLAFDHMF